MLHTVIERPGARGYVVPRQFTAESILYVLPDRRAAVVELDTEGCGIGGFTHAVCHAKLGSMTRAVLRGVGRRRRGEPLPGYVISVMALLDAAPPPTPTTSSAHASLDTLPMLGEVCDVFNCDTSSWESIVFNTMFVPPCSDGQVLYCTM